MNDLTSILLWLGFSILLVGGAIAWSRYRKWRAYQNRPTTWVHVGKPPPDVDVALEVIGAATPGMPKAGTIIWEPKPFLIDWGRLVAGCVDGYDPIQIRVLYDDRVERTALAHELGHVWSSLTNQGFGESPADTRFVKWFSTLNADIARRLGR